MHFAQFDEPTLGLSREFLLRGEGDSVVNAYLNYMVNLATLFGADPETARSDLDDALEFEIALANV